MSQFTNYKPKRWHPEFTLIVMESVGGLDNVELGVKFGYTPQHISNILSTKQAAEIRESIRGELNKQFDMTLKEKVTQIGKKTVAHIEKFVDDEKGRADKSPFEYMEKMLKLATMTGALGVDSVNGRSNNTSNINVQGNAIIVQNDKVSDLRNALMASTELDAITPGDPTPNRNLVADKAHVIGIR